MNNSLPRKISLNGDPIETGAETLEELIAEAGYAGKQVATAVNGDFVPAALRSASHLNDGDKVEVVAPRQGG